MSFLTEKQQEEILLDKKRKTLKKCKKCITEKDGTHFYDEDDFELEIYDDIDIEGDFVFDYDLTEYCKECLRTAKRKRQAGLRLCYECLYEKSILDFDGNNTTCKICQTANVGNRQKRKEKLIRDYGVPIDIAEDFVRGRLHCGACGTKRNLVPDHCHTTQLYRGPLCSDCNSTKGFAHENPQVLRKLADDCEKWNPIKENYKQGNIDYVVDRIDHIEDYLDLDDYHAKNLGQLTLSAKSFFAKKHKEWKNNYSDE